MATTGMGMEATARTTASPISLWLESALTVLERSLTPERA